jgi:HD-GYP domain-containing protein (c-di-GMP phosphodiesterase class II)
MYVAELDRSWLHSPFSGTGFLITAQGQVEQLRQVCSYVYVDPALSDTPLVGRHTTAPVTRAEARVATPVTLARRVLSEALRATAEIVRAARRQGLVDAVALGECAAALVDQVIAGADALHWVLRTESQGGFLCRRAVGTAAVATTLGWQIGLDRAALRAVATGGLLLDLGKIAVPVPILAKPVSLDLGEQAYVRRHVERGLALVAGHEVPERALEMLASHHERVDGSGYPHGLRGTRIPLFGRIAAIADAYDAMTLNRRYAAAISPHTALRQLEALRGEKYDAALVTELVHVLGRYPTGTRVELADGCIALVCAQRRRHAMQPRVVVTHDAARRALDEPRIAIAAGAAEILRSLPPDAQPGDGTRLDSVMRAFAQPA